MKTFLNWVRSHWVSLLIGIALVAGGSWYWQSRQSSETASSPPRIETVKRGDLRVAVSGSGQVEADAQVDLKPVAAGDAIEVTSVLVLNDQEVKKDQIIAVLDNADARRSVDRALLDLRRAKIQLKQTEDLFPKRTRDDMRERQLAEAAVRTSEIALQTAQAKLDDYTIRAPFDGIVTGLSVEGGDTISQTGILASVITKNLKAVITLNEVDAAKVAEGNEVTLSFDALPNETIGGKISKLDTIGTVIQNVVSYGAEIVFDQSVPTLKPGMSVTAEIIVAEKKGALLVPNAALSFENGRATVRVVSRGEEGQSLGAEGERRSVEIGLTDEVNTEVLGGLLEGDRVVVAGAMGGPNDSQMDRQNSGGFWNILRQPTRTGGSARP